MVGAKEVISYPIIGWILKATRVIKVERENKNNKTATINTIIDRANDMK